VWRSVNRLFARAGDPSCPGCGFSLVGLPDTGVCPECGGAYDPDRSHRLVPPSPLRAVGYPAVPLAWGVAAVIAGFIGCRVIDSSTGSEYWTIAFAVLSAILASACVVWSCWRTIVLIDALIRASPNLRQERPLTQAAGCIGTGFAGIVGVCAFGVCVLLTILLGSCLVEGLPSLR